MVKNNNSEIGIHVKFNLETKYENVVRIFDICEIEKVEIYIYKDYDFWIMAGLNAEQKRNCPFNPESYINHFKE
jgi:hypothetical protein